MSKMLYVLVNSPEETLELGEAIGHELSRGSIVALTGELGAGKTVLVKGIAKGLGVLEEPTSPTYVIMNVYEGSVTLYHFDLYRLSSEVDLEAIGYEEYFFGDGVSVVEWAERAQGLFPENTIDIAMVIPEIDDAGIINKREICITGEENWLLSFKNTVGRAFQISEIFNGPRTTLQKHSETGTKS